MLKQLSTLLVLLITMSVNAVVIRHDVNADLYQVNQVPEFYVDMPFQGGSVLIDEHWLLAPAHVIYTFMYDYQDKPIMIHGVENKIAQVIIHDGFKRVEGDWSQGDPKPLMQQMNRSKDIALIRLSNPVTHIKPIALYQGNDEQGQVITGYGRGAIGNGKTGEIEDSQGPSLITYGWYQVTKYFTDWVFTQDNYPMRSYNNVISEANEQWLRFTFEQGASALPLEGMFGSGDSGGAVIMYQNDVPILVGFAAWTEIHGPLEQHVPGKYGTTGVLTRVSYFNQWITQHVNK
ncbi:trypsin-like serine protease [Thalassotalea marina]|uniref:Peptidase S1 domain-containing protein n=1 Tax=Thalassotalea marina TaxID=1673741 RepID=A0A919ELI3_9GAMM|nr:trypsin-like serine protease [Thalassotalea marina]GHF94755.1 hypothetical protein GCM10017161_23780 [Thalassotalea marina]